MMRTVKEHSQLTNILTICLRWRYIVGFGWIGILNIEPWKAWDFVGMGRMKREIRVVRVQNFDKQSLLYAYDSSHIT